MSWRDRERDRERDRDDLPPSSSIGLNPNPDCYCGAAEKAVERNQQILDFSDKVRILERDVDDIEREIRQKKLAQDEHFNYQDEDETSRVILKVGDERDDMRRRANDARIKCGDLTAELNRIREESRGISVQVDRRAQEYEDTRQRVGQLRDVVDERNRKYEEVREEKRQIEDVDREIKEMESRCEEMRKNGFAREGDAADDEIQLQSLEDKIADLMGRIETKNRILRNLEQDGPIRRRDREAIDSKQRAVKEYQIIFDQLQSTNRQLTSRTRTLETEIDRDEAELQNEFESRLGNQQDFEHQKEDRELAFRKHEREVQIQFGLSILRKYGDS